MAEILLSQDSESPWTISLRVSAGFTVRIEAPGRTLFDLATFKLLPFEEALKRNAARNVRVTKLGGGRKRQITVLASELLSPEGTLLPIDRIFEKELQTRNLILKLKAGEFHGPTELAAFLATKSMSFSAHDLIALGHILATRFGPSGGVFHVPGWLADVFSALIEGVSTQAICDPWAGCGVLIGVLREASKAKTTIALTVNQGEYALGKVLVPGANWQVGDPLHSLGEVKQELDVAASILPMDTRSTQTLKLTLPSGEPVELADGLGHLILAAASMRLSSSGIGLFVVTPRFFSSPQSVLRRFDALGLGMEAALALPSGAFAPHTSIPAYLVIVRRKPAARMLVAQLSKDTLTNLQIIGNVRRGKEGGSLDLGRFVAPETFTSIEDLRTADAFVHAQRRFGAPPLKLRDLARAINLGRPGDTFAFRPLENAIFVPLIGNSDVMESLGDLTLKPYNYAQVVIDPARSNARFVARFLNSEIGKQLRGQSKTGTFIPKLTKKTLKDLRVFVPDLHTQQRMLDIEASITAEHNTVMALTCPHFLCQVL
jgi:hypothetical protein